MNPKPDPFDQLPAGDRLSVVIPVLNAEAYLETLLQAIFSQEPVAPADVVLVDSMSTDGTRAIAARYDRVRVVDMPNFSHGKARNVGVREAKGDFVILMTQDALPRDDTWLRTLLLPFEDASVAGVYSRQVPYPDASPMERYFLQTHFPSGPAHRRERTKDAPLTFEDVFFSNVSAAFRREALLDHPFDETLIMSEDQQVSRDLLMAGYAVVYQPASVVIHSHNYTLPVVFKRYFDSVYSLTIVFPKHDMGASASMGLSYLFREAKFILLKHPLWLPYYLAYTFMKATGTIAGHFADRMPRWMLRRLSLHHYHWST